MYGPAKHPLKVLGQFTGKLSYRQRSSKEKIFVAEGLQNNLLGLPAIISWDLAKRIDVTTGEQKTQEQRIHEQFPDLFKGLGTMGEEYTIKLQEDAKPHALYSPRKVPFPLREKVQQELKNMESMGVISKVTAPTPWCAGMVVVMKKSGYAST